MLQNRATEPNARGWYYLTTESAEIQGPFTSAVMNDWANQGFFGDETKVSYGKDGSFFTVGQLFPGENKSEAFLLSASMTNLEESMNHFLSDISGE